MEIWLEWVGNLILQFMQVQFLWFPQNHNNLLKGDWMSLDRKILTNSVTLVFFILLIDVKEFGYIRYS